MESRQAQTERPRASLGNPTTGIRAVLFDFGGVLSASPFQEFARYEAARGLPAGFLRDLNARDHHGNAWARLERGELSLDEFASSFEAEARDSGHAVAAAEVLALLAGEVRPAMIEAVRRCGERYLLGLLTNNFMPLDDAGGALDGRAREMADVMALFDEVVESSKAGVRKPEAAFYELACTRLGIEPQEAVFLDDLGVNLKPARQMGMRTIKVVSETQAIDDLEAVLGIPLR